MKNKTPLPDILADFRELSINHYASLESVDTKALLTELQKRVEVKTLELSVKNLCAAARRILGG